MSGITKKERETLKKLLEKHGDNRTLHFNNLSEAEHERLTILMEECGEVQQIIGKIFRHGYDSYNPKDITCATNRDLLMKELGDVCYAMKLLIDSKDISKAVIHNRTIYKEEKIK